MAGRLPPLIDQKLADKGAELYKTHCEGCHRPPITSEAFYDFNNKDWWTKNQAGEPILRSKIFRYSHIGTDPRRRQTCWPERSRCPKISGSRAQLRVHGELVEKNRQSTTRRSRP